MSEAPQVAIVMGSESDLPVVEAAAEVLDGLGVPYEVRVLSAHRSPEEAAAFAREAQRGGLKVLIAVAGRAAHLAGALAAHTTLPVIGVPVATEPTRGMDSLLSMVQMPSGVPVACMGWGQTGARNAAVMAAQMLALADEELREALRRHKGELAPGVQRQNERVQQWLRDRRGR